MIFAPYAPLRRQGGAWGLRPIGILASVVLHVAVAAVLLAPRKHVEKESAPAVRVVLFQPRAWAAPSPAVASPPQVGPRSARRCPGLTASGSRAKWSWRRPGKRRYPEESQPPEVADERASQATSMLAPGTASLAGPPGTADGPVPVSEVAHPPVLLEQIRPDYPPSARRRGITGLVLLEAVLDVTGGLREPIRVLASVPELDAAAIAALRAWRFAPARDQRGQPVAVIIEVPMRFMLR